MTPHQVQSIRKRAGLSQPALCRILRILDKRTLQRWEAGDCPVSGPASIILELLDTGELPERFAALAKGK